MNYTGLLIYKLLYTNCYIYLRFSVLGLSINFVPVNIICDSFSIFVTYFALRLSALILVTYNYDKFLIEVYSIFSRQLGLYVNMFISLYFLLLSYCHWFHCAVHVVLSMTDELYVFLFHCFIMCACPRWPWLCHSAIVRLTRPTACVYL